MGGNTVRRVMMLVSVFAVFATTLVVGQEVKDTAKAAATRLKLKQKVTVDFKETPLKDVVDEIKEQVARLTFRIDTKGGVSMNRKLTYKAKDKPLEQVLDEMFSKETLGYIVLSNDKDAYDGAILIRSGKERGYPEGKEPKKNK